MLFGGSKPRDRWDEFSDDEPLNRAFVRSMEGIGEATKAFFVELGMDREGETLVEGDWVDRIVGLENVRAEIAMMRTPDGHGRVELTKFHVPAAVRAEPKNAPVKALGIRGIMFAVEDIDDVLARLRTYGADLVGKVAQYEDMHRLCYIRGPECIIVGLAEELG